jgi:cellulose synthase/poly-beta-1,6-N-acetylglucosamine synthase-like glycosyltransferase
LSTEQVLPRIRVAVPALNEAGYIAEALSALEQQTYPKDRYEVVVVVDSGTSDETAEICRQRGVRVLVDDQFHTIAGATDLGFRADPAMDIFASTHADTRVASDWLAVIADVLYGPEAFDGVGGPLHAYPECGFMPELAYGFSNVANELAAQLFRRSYFAGPNYAYRREAYERVGGLDRRLLAGDDNDLSIRMSQAGARLHYERRMRVYTSDRRFKEGYLHTLVTYTKLFVDTNLKRQSHRFQHVR